MRRTNKPLWITLFGIYMAVVGWLYFSSGEVGIELPVSIWGIPFDKIVHYSMFLPFPILGTLAFGPRHWWRTLSIMTLIAIIVAFIFENLQSLVTLTRVTDPADLNANVLGIATGLLCMVVAGLLNYKKQ